jgi:DNA anti-recombination protein RmuC
MKYMLFSLFRGSHFRHKAAAQKSRSPFQFSHLCLALFLVFSPFTPQAYAACGEEISATTQELVAEEQALQTTEQHVRSSREQLRMLDTDLQGLLTNPPESFDKTLARQLAALRSREIEPKRRTLENLRTQHEEARQQWERGHRLLSPQLVEAQTAFQAKTLSREDFCRVREAYHQALRLYLAGMQNYRQGMNLYARALDE